MRIIAFNGSPRKGGNTESLINEAIRGTGQEAEVFNLNKMSIRPCQNCGGCVKTGICVVKDDMQGVFDAIRGADRIIFGSPVFFMSVSAQAKAMIDRCQSIWCEKFLLKKVIEPGPHGRKGLILLVGGMKEERGMDCTETCSKAFLRTVSVPTSTTLRYTDIDARGDIQKHPTALKDAFEAGQLLVK